MKNEFKRIIFDSEGYTFDQAKTFLIEEGIESPSDDQIWDEINECNEITIKDERFEFALRDKLIETPIIIVADVGRWNGRRVGIKRLEHFEEIIDFMTRYDSFEIYIDRYDIRAIGHHHDGTDYILFRMLSDKIDWDTAERNILINKDTDSSVKRYTRSLRKFLKGYMF